MIRDMRWWLPWRRYSIETHLTPEDIALGLSPDLDPEGSWDSGDREWIGTVDPREIRIRRRRRKMFFVGVGQEMRPRLVATIESIAGGSRLDVRIRWSPLIEIHYGVIACVLALMALYETAQAVQHASPARLVMFVPFAALMLITLWRFGREADRAIALLARHAPARAEPPTSAFR